jgi:hypothetical protein
MAKRTKLEMEKLGELSLVDNPGNQHAMAAIFKRMTGAKVTTRKAFAGVFKQFMNAVAPPELIAKEAQSYASTRAVSVLWDRHSALSSSISSILSDDSTAEVKAQQLDVTLSQFRDDIQALIADDSAFAALDPETVGKTETETPPAPAEVAKAEVIPPSVAEPTAGESSDTPAEQGNIMKTTPLTFTEVGAANAHIAKLTTDLNAAVEKVDTLEAAADPLASITKGMPPAAAQLLRTQAETIAKLQTDGQLVVLVTKAKAIAKNTGADLDKLAIVLKAINGNADAEAFVTDVFAKYDAMLGEMEAMVVGDGGESEGGADAMSALDAAAAEIQKLNPKLSHAQAVAKALVVNPALYDETELSEVPAQ